MLFDGGNTEGSERQAVFVDPVTGEVKGALTAYGGSGALPVRTWIDQLHRGLHLGDPGRIFLVVDAVVGLTRARRDPSLDAESEDERAAERDELPVG